MKIKERFEWLFDLKSNCPHCRVKGWVHMAFIIGLLLISAMLVFYLRHDIETQCCQKVKEYNERIKKLQGTNLFSIESVQQTKYYNNTRIIVGIQ